MDGLHNRHEPSTQCKMWTVCNAIQYSSQMCSFVGEQLVRQIASLMSYITLLADAAPLSEHAIVARLEGQCKIGNQTCLKNYNRHLSGYN